MTSRLGIRLGGLVVAIVQYEGCGQLQALLAALGASVVVFPTLATAADALSNGASPSVLIVPLTLAGHDGAPPDGVVLVVKDFRLPAVILKTVAQGGAFPDRFAEILRGPIDARRIAGAVIRAARRHPSAQGGSVRGETVA